MNDEIEAKIGITEEEALSILSTLTGKRLEIEDERELNTLYDDATGSLHFKGICLRLRRVDTYLRGRTAYLLTYKGVAKGGRYKKREELETFLSEEESATIMAIHERLGFHSSFYYEKRRRSASYNDCTICVDLIPHLGWFLEVEGPSERHITRIMKEFGLQDRPCLKDGYPTLIQRYMKQNPKIFNKKIGVSFEKGTVR